MKARITSISPRGFLAQFETESTLHDLPAFEAALIAAGYLPNGQIPRSPEGLPICPCHGEVMRRREKQGDAWYSHRVIDADGEILYCKGRPGADSPGWAIKSPQPRPAQAQVEPATSSPEDSSPTAFWSMATALIQAGSCTHEQAGEIASAATGTWAQKAADLIKEYGPLT